MKPSVYYNEIDAYCAQWLRNLMAAGHIPEGYVDTRSIEDVRPDELHGYTQCHFFAGLGGWAYALRLASWGTRPVWTGSCPCQPFSAAGKGAGFADERHLWPAWQHLIAQRNPAVIFGEQVASATQWLGLVCGDMEGMGYAMGFNHVEAASAGADHRRDRIFFVADTGCGRFGEPGEREVQQSRRAEAFGGGCAGGVADADRAGSFAREWYDSATRHGDTAASTRSDDRLFGQSGARPRQRAEQSAPSSTGRAGPTNGQWRDADWLLCTDGKWRPVEPGTFPLAHGISNRVGRLRAYGNAIVPQVAAAFITAYMQARGLIADQRAVAA